MFASVRPGAVIPHPNQQPPQSINFIINPGCSIICMFFLQSSGVICLSVFVCVGLGSYLKPYGTENYPTVILSCINSYLIYSTCLITSPFTFYQLCYFFLILSSSLLPLFPLFSPYSALLFPPPLVSICPNYCAQLFSFSSRFL